MCAGVFPTKAFDGNSLCTLVRPQLCRESYVCAKGTYTRHYRNTLQAFYTVARTDGLYSIQKGLVPALMYQAVMNSVRLGTYQVLLDTKAAHGENGKTRLPMTILFGAISGCLGSFIASPFYQVKIHRQAHSAPSIAVGYQRTQTSSIKALLGIYREHGVQGLWRGASGAMARVTLGSAAQLSTFSHLQYVLSEAMNREITDLSVLVIASFISGVVVCGLMTPFDVICTRLYNQNVDAQGKGVMYRNILDCGRKILKREGLKAFYKGLGPHYLRIGPHTVLSLVFWGKFRHIYQSISNK